MNHRAAGIAGIILSVALCAVPVPARAGASFDFLFSMDRVSNDKQFFLNVAVSNYGYDRAVLEPVLPRVQYVEVDLPVILFLAHASGRPPGAIVDLRAQGLSWSVIFTRVGVPYDVLFEGMISDPGPPYGNAWGYWRKNPRDLRLSDNDVTELVQLQIGAQAAGVAPLQLARARGQGRPIAVLVAEKKGRPYHGAKGPKGHKPHH